MEVNRLISVEGVLTSSDFWEASRQSPDTDFGDLGNIKMIIKKKKKKTFTSTVPVFFSFSFFFSQTFVLLNISRNTCTVKPSTVKRTNILFLIDSSCVAFVSSN